MTQHVLLDNVAHKDLRIRHRYAPGHGFDANIARVFPVELGILQAEYPLFFIKNTDSGHFEPVALLGFEEGENLFLGGDQWLARVQPLSIQRQPFLITGRNDAAVDPIPDELDVGVDVAHDGTDGALKAASTI